MGGARRHFAALMSDCRAAKREAAHNRFPVLSSGSALCRLLAWRESVLLTFPRDASIRRLDPKRSGGQTIRVGDGTDSTQVTIQWVGWRCNILDFPGIKSGWTRWSLPIFD